MRKRKRKKEHRKRSRLSSWLQRQQPADLEPSLKKAENLIRRGRAQEAIALLEPLVESYPRVADLHSHIGHARTIAGDPWGAVAAYERALALSREPGYWLPLASLYLELDLNVHALHAFREVLREQLDIPMIDEARKTVAALEQDISDTATHLRLPVERVEEGLRHLEQGQRVLRDGDFSACIAANRRAIKRLGDWPPPHNNLSLALFFDGQPEEAIAITRQVLSHAPENVQALSNAIRFLTWTGHEPDARMLWERLRNITPEEDRDRIKKAEAAAILEEDESVYESLKPLDKTGPDSEPPAGRSWLPQFFLAIAEANTGRQRAARRRLEALQHRVPWAGDLRAALEAGKPGPGWAERYPYFHSSELIPGHAMGTFVELVTRQDEIPHNRFRREVDGFIERFPQIVLVAEKLIWEDNQPEAGIAMLEIVGTPAAYATIRRFGLSQAGDDEARMQALFRLAQAGQIAPDETLKVWSDGEWREIQLRQFEITEEDETHYTQEVADLLNEGLEAFRQNDHERAEGLFQHALDLEPLTKEAYNNLGAIYARRGDHERAKEMFRAVLEIDPTYVFPRGNLALYLLDEGDIEGAQAMLAPLADVTRLRPLEMAFYSYVQARILIHEKEYEPARRSLKAALQIMPGYQPAEELLERLKLISRVQAGWESFMEQRQKRDQTKRARLQARLSTPDPSLSDVLPIYTKEALTGTGRVVMPWGGWTGLRKAPLVDEIIAALQDRDNLERIVADLNDDERAALRQVLESGGSSSWQEFDVRFGNDLEESAYWQWHEPETPMGRLRLRGLLAEATVDGELLIVVPSDLRQSLQEMLE